ncbi:MAG: ABC transporter substrate-binding protein [Desulfovibrio sp.]
MRRAFLYALSCVLLIFSVGCGGNTTEKTGDQALLDKEFSQIVKDAKGTTVRIYMYGGLAQVNKWIDGWVSEQMKTRYDITLERVPMDASVFVNKLLTEKSAGVEKGVMDALWINGENFKNARKANLLFGPYAEKLPNFNQYVNKELAAYDFGMPVDGYETPYGWAQFVFEYDKANHGTKPESFAALQEWIIAHPGKFTYPQPPDFTGSAFIRHLFYALTGGYEQYMGGFDQELFNKNAPKLWAWLNEVKPYLWQKGRTYPKGISQMDTLFARGEIAINMSYHPLHAQSKILDGTYRSSVESFIMPEASIFNLHFWAIPYNAPNKAGAMVFANFMMSPEAQLSKFDPANWGDYPAIDVSRMTEEMQKTFKDIDLGSPTLTPAELAQSAVPEIPAEYVVALEKGWLKNVLNQLPLETK